MTVPDGLDVDAIRARADAATPGPWSEMCMGSEGYFVFEATPSAGTKRRKRVAACMHEDWETDKANAEFIAHAREDVPKLLDERKRLIAELRVTRDQVAALECDREEDAAALAVAVQRADTAEAAIQRRLFDECETAGWDPDKRNTFAEECAHLHEEVSEAFRAWRLTKDAAKIWYDDDGKPQGVPIELADVLIGLFYNAELHGFDLLAAVEVKHAWNLKRSYPAEGRQLHPAALSSPVPVQPDGSEQ